MGPIEEAQDLTDLIPSAVAEEYRRLKHIICAVNRQKRTRSILFCSPVGGEGTTTVASQFAVTLATEGEKILLVDANVRNPAVHRVFDMEADTEPIAPAEQPQVGRNGVKETVIKNLRIVTGVAASSAVYCSLNQAEALFPECWKTQADWIIFDSSPLITTGDGIPFAMSIDGAVLVARAEKTRLEDVQRTVWSLQSSGVPLLGIVLNDSRMHIPGWLQGHR